MLICSCIVLCASIVSFFCAEIESFPRARDGEGTHSRWNSRTRHNTGKGNTQTWEERFELRLHIRLRQCYARSQQTFSPPLCYRSFCLQSRALWQLRESIAEGLSKSGAVYKYDISLPVHTMYQMVERMKKRLSDGGIKEDEIGVVGYGHLGDGNLHLNIHTPKYRKEVLQLIEPWLFEQTGQENNQ